MPSLILLLNGATINSFVAKMDDSGPCAAAFSLYPDSLTQHLYWAVEQSSGVQPISFLWEWGDGNTDTIQYPSHTYAIEGFYTICLTITDSTSCTNTICNTNYLQRNAQPNELSNTMVVVNVVPFIPNSIQEISQQQIGIFPNPTNNQFAVSLPEGINNYELYIVDMLGKVWMRHLGAGSENLQLDVTELPHGVYFVNLRSEKFVATQKLMVAE